MRRISHRLGPWLLLGAGELVSAGFLALPDARTGLGAYLLLMLAGSLLSLLAARSLSASRIGFLLLCGGLFRATLLPRAPDLSDDLYRYAWDGRVAAAGISPYRFRPDAPQLSGVAPGLLARVGHRDVRTVYPPVSQAVFRLAAAAGPATPMILKVCFASADLAVVALLAGSGAPAARWAAALYAFHPLAVTESAGQGHLDSLGIALLLAAAAFVRFRRPVAAGVAFALSVLTKYVSGAGLLVFARRGGARFTAAAAVVAALTWSAAAQPGASPGGDLSQYATRWEYNSVLYPAAVALMERTALPDRAKRAFISWKERLHHPSWTQSVFPFFYAGFFARALLATLLALALALVAWRARSVEGALLASLGALLVASPTLHPWYLLWVLPFAATRKEPGFLFLSFSVPVSYSLLYPGGLPPGAVLAIEYVPFLILLAVSAGRAARRPAAASA